MNANTSSTVAVPEPESLVLLRPEERTIAADLLLASREKVLQLTGDCSDGQWQFKPAPDQWSIGEITEHLVIVEKRVQERVREMVNAEAAEPGRDDAQVDDSMKRVFARTTKVPAPSMLLPSGQWSRAEGVEKFVQARSETMTLLESAPALRGRVIAHPILGSLDGYQWILAVAGHCTRHIEQMLEVRSAPDFPPS